MTKKPGNRTALVVAVALSVVYVAFVLLFAFTDAHPFPAEPHSGPGSFSAKPWVFNVTMWVLLAASWITYSFSRD